MTMIGRSSRVVTFKRLSGRALATLVCAVALLSLCVARAPAAMGAFSGGARTGQVGAGASPSASTTLEQCVTATLQSERSATFSGEMTAVAGSVRMAIQIKIQAQLPGEAQFHTVNAPRLGAWRTSDPGVKTFRYLKQVTNLFAPALYRAAVRFRWLNAKGHMIKDTERRSAKCEQPDATSLSPSAPSVAITSPPGSA
jgi:hypothetical protein